MNSAAAENPTAPAGVDTPVNLLDLDRQRLKRLFADLGEKPFRATQVLKWVHQRRVTGFEQMTDISKALRARLAEQVALRLPEVLAEQVSEDGTRKWLLRVDGGQAIETVFIPDNGRGTLCVSSQVGCALDCSFCSTAQQGFNRNLSTAEIIGQYYVAYDQLTGTDEQITNVVFMGMGEPLLNLDAVIPAVRLMTDDDAYGLSKRKVTISTSGVVTMLERMREQTDVSLAVSLHAPNNALRDELVPINRKHPLERLIPACAAYIADKPHRRITWEYVMLDGVNDQDQHAHELARLLGDIPSKVNLIPFNPFPGARYRCSPRGRILRFVRILQSYGLTATTRVTRGQDIDGACGQLVGKVQDRTRRQQRLVQRELRREGR